MLTRLRISNFKLFEEVDIELGERVVFVGPNNSGKTSALQALALWSVGVRRWSERRGASEVRADRTGVTINRRDLITVPVPRADLFWRDLRVREGYRDEGQNKTKNILMQVDVSGTTGGENWSALMDFDYANPESFYCRARLVEGDRRHPIPEAASRVRLAYLPPMSGLAANEVRLDPGAIDVRVGEGRTAEVLRNLCWLALEQSPERWRAIVDQMNSLFGCSLNDPVYIPERGEISLTYRTRSRRELDLSAAGRGQQQTLLLLAHLAANPGSVLLLDEPDAHLEVLRQRQIYHTLTETATSSGSQIIAASHSEVFLQEAADRDMVVAFVGPPHRMDRRGSQVAKALKDIGFDQYLLAMETGWVLYLEGSTDLAILREFARLLHHEAAAVLDSPFVHYVANQPLKAKDHFYGLREAKGDLVGVGVFDRLDAPIADPTISFQVWQRREIENYLCQPETLLRFAEDRGRREQGDLFASRWRKAMQGAIQKIEEANNTLGKDSWGANVKATDDVLTPIFRRFYADLGLPNLLDKTDFHLLAGFADLTQFAPEIAGVLNEIVACARRAVVVPQPGDL